MPRQGYDPKKAHDYYERTKKLKGREKTATPTAPVHIQTIRGSRADGSSRINRHTEQGARARDAAAASDTHAAQARVVRLKSAVSKLQTALTATMTALREKQQASRESARKTAKKNSDGSSTEKEKTASKKYRDKHQAEIAAKRKKDSPASDSEPSSSSTGVSSMSVDELQSRVIRIRGALGDTKNQLSTAQQQLGQLAHSAITSEPTFDDDFARFRSAERIPFQ